MTLSDDAKQIDKFCKFCVNSIYGEYIFCFLNPQYNLNNI
jgi:hypothetical protein